MPCGPRIEVHGLELVNKFHGMNLGSTYFHNYLLRLWVIHVAFEQECASSSAKELEAHVLANTHRSSQLGMRD